MPSKKPKKNIKKNASTLTKKKNSIKKVVKKVSKKAKKSIKPSKKDAKIKTNKSFNKKLPVLSPIVEDIIEDEIILMDDSINDDIDISDDETSSKVIDLEIPDVVEEIEDDTVVFKHKENDKHKLSYDKIFRGKLNEEITEEYTMHVEQKFSIDKSTTYWFEHQDNEVYVREKKLKEKIYDILKTNTEMDFHLTRRKPARTEFNGLFNMIVDNVYGENFTMVEIFNELSVYFSDNLFNMFKLLDNRWRLIIISELQRHVGKQSPNAKIIKPKNLTISAEIEFSIIVEDIKQLYTGVIIETNHVDGLYKVDSFENIYNVNISDITKILNNNKFRYNINILNNTDFL
jgi:hypothetical protein